MGLLGSAGVSYNLNCQQWEDVDNRGIHSLSIDSDSNCILTLESFEIGVMGSPNFLERWYVLVGEHSLHQLLMCSYLLGDCVYHGVGRQGHLFNVRGCDMKITWPSCTFGASHGWGA